MADTTTKKRKYNQSEAKRNADKARSKTRVNLGLAFTRFRALKDRLGLRSDAELAIKLLDNYESGPPTSTPHKRLSVFPAPVSPIIPGTPELQISDIEAIPGSSAEEVESMVSLEKSLTSMNIQDVNVDEEQYNHLMHTVICWSDEATLTAMEASVAEEEDSGEVCFEEDYVPSIALRTAGALQMAQVNLQTLPPIGLDETVYGSPEEPEDTGYQVPDLEELCVDDDIVGQPAYIAYHSSLKTLSSFLVLPVQQCPVKDCNVKPPFQANLSSRGSAAIITWVCSEGHTVWEWNSQPRLKFNMQVGDFMMAVNILLSGNNFAKVQLLFKFLNIGFVSRGTFFRIQNAYCVDSIKEFWKEKRAAIIKRLCTQDSVVALADGRMDSPGHCAQFCTYTAMDNDSKEIISVITVDKRETQRKSVLMEKEAFIKTMDLLMSEVNLKEICTDAHVQISALLSKGKYKDAGVFHSLDMWHGAKNLAKKIVAAGQHSGSSILLLWVKDIVNHFWWCCKQATTHLQFMDVWMGILHHVANEHEWIMGKCQHDCLATDRTKTWIERGTKAHSTLTAIVTDKRWLKNVYKYLNFRSTSELESFQNHILMYASKRFSYSPPVYEARTILAALDYNYHKDRPAKKNQSGQTVMGRVFKKRSCRWSLYTVKTPKDYGYISNIQKHILEKRRSSEVGLPRKMKQKPDDPRQMGPLPNIPPPSLEDLIQAHVSRGQVPG